MCTIVTKFTIMSMVTWCVDLFLFIILFFSFYCMTGWVTCGFFFFPHRPTISRFMPTCDTANCVELQFISAVSKRNLYKSNDILDIIFFFFIFVFLKLFAEWQLMGNVEKHLLLECIFFIQQLCLLLIYLQSQENVLCCK